MANIAPYLIKQETNSYIAIGGFRVPMLPVHTLPIDKQTMAYKALLQRFTMFLQTLHYPNEDIALALQATAWPREQIGSRVDFSILCRVQSRSEQQAKVTLVDALEHIQAVFPAEASFGYAELEYLDESALSQVFFQQLTGRLSITEISKYAEPNTIKSINICPDWAILPHPWFVSLDFDLWLTLIEVMHRATSPTLLRVRLEPYKVDTNLHAKFAEVLGKYTQTVQDGEQRRDLLKGLATLSQKDGFQDMAQIYARVQALRAQGVGEAELAQARRGQFIYQQLIAQAAALWRYQLLLSSQGTLSTALQNSIQRLLSVSSETFPTNLGWHPPKVVHISTHKNLEAIENIQWMKPALQKSSQQNVDPDLQNLDHVVTSQEAAGLFHLPMYGQFGATSALSHTVFPFIVPSELAEKGIVVPGDNPSILLGHAYQRAKLLSPEYTSHPFEVKLPRGALEKPGLLVGAPGSGKTNLTLHILAQLWGQCDHTPFLVLDPSNSYEYRYLFADPNLQQKLVVFTVGEDTQPFYFNPFQVPPRTTVRSHITRLLGCFRAAIDMWDPLPAIYQEALINTYTQLGWSLNEKGGSNKPSPTIGVFADMLNASLGDTLSLYGEDTEVAGNLRGASVLRVNSIRDSLEHIIGVQDVPNDYFQELLQNPVVLELGSIGDSDDIALVMAFLIAVLRGHIEYAHHTSKRRTKPHLLVVEEAHRLLSTEGIASKPDQGNVRLKSAQDFNNMLSEIRKFRQGVLVLDQRPSSLVGGVLDNTLVNLVCRLNDAEGFDRLAKLLNLNEMQTQYARTRMQPGDTLVLDRSSGQPVLLRSTPYMRELQKSASKIIPRLNQSFEEFCEAQMKQNIPLSLLLSVKKQSAGGSGSQGISSPSCNQWKHLVDTVSKGMTPDLVQRLAGAMYSDEGIDIDWPEISLICHSLFGNHPNYREVVHCFLQRWVEIGKENEPSFEQVLVDFEEHYHD